MRKRWKMPLFYRYLLSYVLVLGIPILVIGLTLYSHIVNLMREQAFEANRKVLTQVSDIVDSKFREFMNIAGTISNSSDFSTKPPQNPYEISMVRKRLNYEIGNNFIRELLFYPHGGTYIFSNSSSYTLPFFHQIFRFEEWQETDFERTIGDLKHPTLTLATRDEGSGSYTKQFVYMVPIPLNSMNPKGTALFTVDEKSILDLFQALMKYRDGNTFVIDGQGRILTSLQPIGAKDVVFIERILRSDMEGTETVKTDGNIYYVSYAKSRTIGLTYVTIVPDKELMQPVNEIKNKSVVSAVLILLFGAVFIYFGMRLNYKPLLKLIRHGEARWGSAMQHAHGFDKIKAIMEYAEHMQSRLNRHEEHAQPAMRQHLLSGLLKGRFKTKEAFHEAGQTVGLKLGQSAYQVVILHYDPRIEDGSDFRDRLYSRLQERMPDDAEIYFVTMVEDGKEASIISVDPAGLWSEEAWSDIRQSLAAELNGPVTIGIGNAYREIGELYKSFIEASTAIQYSAVKGKNRVIMFHEASAARVEQVWYPASEMQELKEALKRKESAEVMRIAGLLVDKIRDNSTTLFMATYLCTDITNMVWRTMQETCGGKYQSGPKLDVMALTQLGSFDEYAQVVMDVCSFAAGEFESIHSRSAEQELYQSMLVYLETHALEYHFSVQGMAESFSWSASHIRRVFKERSGVTISDHVHELRIHKAKLLLTTTDMSLQEIVVKIGYSDVSSFIRKFKQHTGVTPRDYRRTGL
ncbi:helix-turn-helix domain-containing protein [Paenibacillus silviterrae]|uniref:helix-turn-helix domain-containing protein n=1 Tax=Paenibacillus silviterrae TaxID=3242194 RepID=UPI002543D6D6|nr:helix-turn-helix domain-containing protein [Paenibacillus chinjuensis]